MDKTKDKTKEQSDAEAANSTNSEPRSQNDGLSYNHQEHQNSSETPSNTVRKPHCHFCNMETYFIGTSHVDQVFDHDNSPAKSDEPCSPCYTSFSGVTLDQAQHGQLSEFHGLADDGDGDDWSEEWVAMATGKLQSLVSIGLAAVRVKVESAHLPGLAGQIVELSGFRVSHDMIITCAYFTDWILPGNNVECFLNGENGVCEAIQAKTINGNNVKGRFGIRLWAINQPWDIAVFRMTDRPVNDSKLPVIQKKDVHLFTPEERRQLVNNATARFWSIGYNLGIHVEELHETFTKFYARRQDDEKMKISRRYNLDDSKPPGRRFLQPNTRTVSFGTRIGMPHNARAHQACVELSAWHGRSGSMVCTEKEGRSVVIGMVQGGEKESDCNLILLFNTDMREWLRAAIDLDDSGDQQHFGKRVVMG